MVSDTKEEDSMRRKEDLLAGTLVYSSGLLASDHSTKERISKGDLETERRSSVIVAHLC